MTNDPGYKVVVQDDFIRLEMWGPLRQEKLTEPVDAAIKRAEQKHVKKILYNVEEVDFSYVPVTMQAKGMGILLKLQYFERIAVVYKDKEAGRMFASSLQELQSSLSAKFKGFDNETDAIAWLEEDGLEDAIN